MGTKINPIILNYCEIPTDKPKLYWVELETQPHDTDLLSEVLLEETDWAYIYEDKVYSSTHVSRLKKVLKHLEEEGHKQYLYEYTEEELFEEVADNWQDLAEFIFGNSFITGENLQKAYELAQQKKPLEEVLSVLVREKVEKIECRGYSQGDYVVAYATLGVRNAEDIEAYLEAYLFGTYRVWGLMDENDDICVRALVLDTPKYYDDDTLKSKILEEAGVDIPLSKIGTAYITTITKWAKIEPQEK